METELALINGTQSRLEELATRINEGHERCLKHARRTVQDAVEIGQDLIEAKRLCGHGSFMAWIKANCVVAQDQANRYMRIARKFFSEKNLPETIRSIDETIEALNPPEEEPGPDTGQGFGNCEAFVAEVNNQFLWIREQGGIAGYTQGWTSQQLAFFLENLRRFHEGFGRWIEELEGISS